MSSSHRIIASGPSLVLCPAIKQHVGLPAALVLQQLHYWLSQQNPKYGIIDTNGRQWIRNTYEQWREQIQVLTLSTLRRAFSSLESKKIILSQRTAEKSKFSGGNQVKYYTIDYDQLETVVGNLSNVSINRPKLFTSNNSLEGEGASKTVNLNKRQKPILKLTTDQSNANGISNTPSHLLKMNRQPAQNEQILYITKNTSEITSFFDGTRTLFKNNSSNLDEYKVQPAKPAEVEKNSLVEEMICFWNEIVEQKQRKIALTPKRIKQLRAAFKQFFKEEIVNWEAFCSKIASSKFLMGEVSSFRAHFDWALRFDIIQRILEDGYSFGDRVIPQKQNSSEGEGGTQSIQTQCIAQMETKESLKIRALLKLKLERKYGDNVNYNGWFMNTVITVEEKEDETIRTLFVKTSFIRDMILTRFADIYETLFDAIQIGLPDTNQQSGNAPTQKVCDELQNQIEKMDLENNNTLSLEENKELCEPLSEHVDPDNNIDLSYTNASQERTISLYEENIKKPLPIVDVDHEEPLYQEKSNIEPQGSLINPSYNLEQKAEQSPAMDEKSYLPIQDDSLTISSSLQNNGNKIRIPKKRMSCVLRDIKTLQIHKMLKQHLPLAIYEEKFKDPDIRIRDGNTIFVISAHERHNNTYDAYHEIIKSIFDEIVYEEESTIHCQMNHSDVHIVNEPSEVQDAISDLSPRDEEFYLTRLNQLTSVHQEPIQNMVEEETKATQTREKIYYDKQDPPEKKTEQAHLSRFEGLITRIGTKSFGQTNKLKPFNKNQSTMGSSRDCIQKGRHPLETQCLNYTERISLFANGLSEYKAHSWNAYGEYRKSKISPPVHMQKRHLKRSYIFTGTIDPPFATRINVSYKAFGCSCINLLAYQSKNCLSKVPLFLERQ